MPTRSHHRFRARLGVLEIEPYAPGSNTARRGATVFKLSSNDAPLGPSPKAMCAYHEAAEHLAVYPDRLECSPPLECDRFQRSEALR